MVASIKPIYSVAVLEIANHWSILLFLAYKKNLSNVSSERGGIRRRIVCADWLSSHGRTEALSLHHCFVFCFLPANCLRSPNRINLLTRAIYFSMVPREIHKLVKFTHCPLLLSLLWHPLLTTQVLIWHNL